MKSEKSFMRSAANRSGSGRDNKLANDADMGDQSEAFAASQIATEPDTGAEAPEAPAHDVACAEEATEDVEFPEAVVLVGKTHWRCVTCMLLCPRTSSVDDHLTMHHRQPDPPLVLSPAPKRGRGRGRGVSRDKTISHALNKSEPHIQQKVLRSSVHPVEDAEREKTAFGGETGQSSSKVLRGKGKKGGKSNRRAKSQGSRGRGRVFTKPLTSEDSDTEVEASTLRPALNSTPDKRKTGTSVSVSHDANESADNIQLQSDVATKPTHEATKPTHEATPPRKKAKSEENDGCYDITPTKEIPVEHLSASCENVFRDAVKALMKEKYVVFVGKGGTVDYPLEPDTHIDIDPPLPIETPSLQADAFLPPATPLLPDIPGPPETPVPPDTPHLPEVPHHPDPFQPPETSGMDCQGSIQPEFMSPITPGAMSAIASEHLSKTEENGDVEERLVSDHFSSSGLILDKRSEKEFASASVCVTCGAVFESPDELRLHREEMVKFDIMSCNSCGDKFHGLHQLNIHVFTAHEKFAKKFCFLCDVDCLDGFELEEHLLEHTSEETDVEENTNDLDCIQHTCKTCGMEVEGNLSDLVNHYHTTHDQFVCTKCYDLFTDLTEYEDHKMLPCSHADAPVVYSCPVSDCFQICEDKQALMDHISWHEDRDIDDELRCLLQCQYCSDQFRNFASMERHLAETHNEPDLRPFVCELCREDFSHSLELHQHNAIRHAGIKRYGCAYCDQRFAFRSAHRRHVASEHDVAATVLRM